MKEKLLLTSSFLPRKIILLGKNDKDTEKEIPEVMCSECGRLTPLVVTKEVKTQCKHEEQCPECRDYQIEKCFRCAECCVMLLGHIPPYCCSECSRQKLTQKSSAVCAICETNLQKECKFCKHSAHYKDAKKLLKKKIFVLVQSPQYVNITQRPCAHYALCKQCKRCVARGHKGKSICLACRQDNAITISTFGQPYPITKNSTDNTSNNVNDHHHHHHHQNIQSNNNSSKQKRRDPVAMTVEYGGKNGYSFSGHSVLSVINKQRSEHLKQPKLYCDIPEDAIPRSTFLGIGDEYLRTTSKKIEELPPLPSLNFSPVLPSFRSLLTSPNGFSPRKAKIDKKITLNPIVVDETMYNVCTNKIW